MRKVLIGLYASFSVTLAIGVGLLVGSEHPQPPRPVPPASGPSLDPSFLAFYTGEITKMKRGEPVYVDESCVGVFALLAPCDRPDHG